MAVYVSTKKRDDADNPLLFGGQQGINQQSSLSVQRIAPTPSVRVAPMAAQPNISVDRSTPAYQVHVDTPFSNDNFRSTPEQDFWHKAGALGSAAGGFVLGNTAKLLNTAAAGGYGLIKLADIGKESVFGTDKSYQDKLNDTAYGLEYMTHQNPGLFGKGTFFANAKDEEGNDIAGSGAADLERFGNDPVYAAKKTGGAGLAVASEVAPVAEGGNLALKGGSTAVKVARAGGEGAVIAGVGSAGSQLAEDGNIDLKRTAGDVAAGAGLGVAGYAGGRLVGNALQARRLEQMASEENSSLIPKILEKYAPHLDDAATQELAPRIAGEKDPAAIKALIDAAESNATLRTSADVTTPEAVAEQNAAKTPDVHVGISDDLKGAPNVDLENIKLAERAKLQLGGDTAGSSLSAKTVQEYVDKILKGEQIDPLVRQVDANGNEFIQDGKHRLAALDQLGINEVPVVDQISKEAPRPVPTPEQGAAPETGTQAARAVEDTGKAPTVPEQAIASTGVAEGAAVRNPEILREGATEATPLLKEQTVSKLVDKYGAERTQAIIDRTASATNVRNADAFAVAEARKQFGEVVKVKGQNVPVPTVATVAERTAQLGDDTAGLAPREVVRVGNPVEVKTGIPAQIQQAFIDRDHVVIQALKDMEKQTGSTGLVDQFMYDTGLQSRANSIANAKLRNSEQLQAALGGLDKTGLSEFNLYSEARSELANAAAGKPTSRPVEELQSIVDNLAPEYEGRFKNLNLFYKDLARDAYEGGLISEQRLNDFLANDDYVRIQRDFDELVNRPAGVGNAYSLGSSITAQTRKGSKRAILPADITAFDYTQQLQKEIQRNQTATNLIHTLEGFGMAKNLVSANDVNYRKEIWNFLADTREGKDLVNKVLGQGNRELRLTQREVDALNKEGLNIRLSQEGTVTTRPLPDQNLKPRQVRALVQSMIQQDPAELGRVKRMIANREPKLAELIDRVSTLQATSDAYKVARKEAYQSAMARADQATGRRNTIKRIVNGTTEVYEIDPAIKQVIDNVAPYQLNALERIIAAPGRVFRAGTTGLSAPFTAANYLKDQFGSGINSKDLLATHNPANILDGLWQASKDGIHESNDELWQKFIRHAGDTTQYDMTRNVRGARELSREIRGGAAQGVGNKLIHPIRTLEDLNSITEKATRFQNFKGIYQQAIKAGVPEQEAIKQATLAAWQNSVDFNRAGDWARAINLLVPYFNAGIQGSRQLVRTGTRDGLRGLAGATIKTVGLVTTPLAALTAYNLMDPDRAAVYNNISEFEKEHNFILIPPGATQNKDGSYNVWKIPIPPGFGNLAMPTRRAIESYASGNPADMKQIGADILNAVSGPIDPHNPAQAAASLIPQVVKPFVQQVANKDLFTGKDIVPDYINTDVGADGKPIAENQKVFEFSGATARAIGGVLGVSPIRVEKFIKDTFGKSGQYTENAVDQLLVHAGVAPDTQIGGVSVKDDIIRRFGEAQSNYNFQKSDAAKHFDDQKVVLNDLSKSDQDAYNTIHPRAKNSTGEVVNEKTILDTPEKMSVYINHPAVLEADRKLDQMQRDRGKPGNPMFDLTPDQLHQVLVYRSAKMLNAGKQTYDKNGTPLFTALGLDEPWYDNFRKGETQYYKDLGLADKGKDTPSTFSGAARPEPSDALQAKMDVYYTLPKGDGSRTAYLNANPDILDYWNLSDGFTNKERSAIGLKPVDDPYDPSSPNYKGGSGGGGGRSSVAKTASYGGAGAAPKVYVTAPKSTSTVKVAKRPAPKKISVTRKKLV